MRYIEATVAKMGHPPTLYEMGRAMGGITVKAVKDHLTALEKKGYIKRTPGKRRAVVPVQNLNKPSGIPIIGKVAAGVPLLATENLEGTLPLAPGAFGKDRHFALQIRGDSMRGAGIFDGDYVIVRQQETADPGDIVVALLDEEATVKILRKRGRDVYLEAANPAYPDIPLEGMVPSAKILGRVVGLYRIIP